MLLNPPLSMERVNSHILNPVLTLGAGSPLATRLKGVNSKEARLMLLAIGAQESKFRHRFQIIEPTQKRKGPARGFWQFELGGIAGTDGRSKWGVYHHPASREPLRRLCQWLSVEFRPEAIWEQLEYNDWLAAGVARLLLWTDPRPLPPLGDMIPAWNYYLRTWRPGKPRERTWAGHYIDAYGVVDPRIKAQGEG